MYIVVKRDIKCIMDVTVCNYDDNSTIAQVTCLTNSLLLILLCEHVLCIILISLVQLGCQDLKKKLKNTRK